MKLYPIQLARLMSETRGEGVSARTVPLHPTDNVRIDQEVSYTFDYKYDRMIKYEKKKLIFFKH